MHECHGSDFSNLVLDDLACRKDAHLVDSPFQLELVDTVYAQRRNAAPLIVEKLIIKRNATSL